MLLNCEVFVIMCLELHADMDSQLDMDRSYMFVLISSVLTWARSKPVDPVTSHSDITC